jgi:protease IV
VNLIDDFGYVEDVIAAMKNDHKLKGAQVFEYTSGDPFSEFFSMSAKKMIGKDLEATALMKLLSQPNSPRLMYLYSE